jgi:CheY-like chemotaxis protein
LSTLLAIDDSKTMRKVIEIAFAGENHRLVLSDNADDAVGKLRSEQPAVVLIDANLGGGGGGYGLCQVIKREAPQARVLLLSSKQQPYDRPRGASSGADDFIDKPFDTQQLIDKVNALAKAAATAPAAAAPATRERAPTMAYGSPSAPAQRVQTAIGVAAPPLPPPQAPAAPPPPPQPVAAPAPVAAAPQAVRTAVASDGQFAKNLGNLGLSEAQVQAVLALSRDVVEKVVWEVVPVLAETLIKEEIKRLTAE